MRCGCPPKDNKSADGRGLWADRVSRKVDRISCAKEASVVPAYCRQLELTDDHLTAIEVAAEQCHRTPGFGWIAELLGYLLPPAHLLACDPSRSRIPPHPTLRELHRLNQEEAL
jgi:hypothetical protein